MAHDCKRKKNGIKDKKFDKSKSNKSKSRRSESLKSPTLLVFDTCLVRDEDVQYLDLGATRHVWYLDSGIVLLSTLLCLVKRLYL
jgi:hypothetical protein